MRTADALGVKKVYLSGYTPYPSHNSDTRLPHEALKISRQINKTALGAELNVKWQHVASPVPVISALKTQGYKICALEQSKGSLNIQDYKPAQKLVLLLGREVKGIEPDLLELADTILEIPMLGKKESLNVVQAAAIALYHLRFYSDIRKVL